MDILIVKKKEYEVVKEIKDGVYKLTRDGVFYYTRIFGPRSSSYFDFLYAYKHLKNSGVVVPKLLVKDKKQGIVVLEWISGKTVFEELQEHELEEKYYELAFIQNWHARVGKLLLDFNPRNFIMYNNNLYYISYKVSDYNRQLDFSTNDIYLWFYTKKFRDYLIEEHLPLNPSRIKNEFQQNKDIVLTVVKYYR